MHENKSVNHVRRHLAIAIPLMLVAVFAMGVFPGCAYDFKEANMQTKEFDLTGFNKIEIGEAFDVDITQSDSYKVSVAADDFSHVRVEKNGDTLVIRRQGIDWFAPFRGRMSATVTLPVLRELDVSGASRGKFADFNADEGLIISLSGASNFEARNISAGSLNIKASGASHLSGDINARNDMKLEASGASKVDLSGTAASAVMNISGASKVEMSKFAVQSANLEISGASNAQINLNGRLDANVSGASTLCWSGSPLMGDIQTSGASTLRRK